MCSFRHPRDNFEGEQSSQDIITSFCPLFSAAKLDFFWGSRYYSLDFAFYVHNKNNSSLSSGCKMSFSDSRPGPGLT